MFWCERRDHKWWGIDRALTAPEDGDVRTCLRCGTQDQWGPWPPLAADPEMRWVCIR